MTLREVTRLQKSTARMNFCQECNNLLYPRVRTEDGEKLLMYECKTCEHVEAAEENCVYRRKILNDAAESAIGIVHNIINDPTLPRTRAASCPTCGANEAVFFQAQGQRESGMTLFFVCTSCECKWTK